MKKKEGISLCTTNSSVERSGSTLAHWQSRYVKQYAREGRERESKGMEGKKEKAHDPPKHAPSKSFLTETCTSTSSVAGAPAVPSFACPSWP